MTRTGEQITPATPRPSGDCIVLLVDDSKTIRRTAASYLGKAGYSVVTASDGFEALSKVVEYRPAVIFVDIVMPRLDGYQTCALIKNNAEYRNIPVVMLSSNDGLFDKARGRVVGSNAHVSKPFTEDSLLDALKMHLAVPSAMESQDRTPDKTAVKASTQPVSTEV